MTLSTRFAPLMVLKGTEAAARDLGNVDVQFMMPDNGTAATQKQGIGTGSPPRPTDYAARRQGGRAERATVPWESGTPCAGPVSPSSGLGGFRPQPWSPAPREGIGEGSF